MPTVSGRMTVATPLLSLAGGAGLWEVLGRLLSFPFLPPLSEVVARLLDMVVEGEILGALGTSVTNLVIAMVIAVSAGLIVGVAMGVSWRVEAAIGWLVNALLTAPTLVFAPVYFSIFGLSRWAVVTLIVHYSIFLIIITAADAVRAPPSDLLEMARSFNATPWTRFRRVALPAAVPLIMAGLRLGTGRAVKGMINGEMFIAIVGLGAAIQGAARQFDATTILAVLLITVMLAVVIQQLVIMLDNYLTRWLPSVHRP